MIISPTLAQAEEYDGHDYFNYDNLMGFTQFERQVKSKQIEKVEVFADGKEALYKKYDGEEGRVLLMPDPNLL